MSAAASGFPFRTEPGRLFPVGATPDGNGVNFSLYSDGATGVDGGGRPGPVFAQSASGPGVNVFEQLRTQSERWRTEGRRIVIAAAAP